MSVVEESWSLFGLSGNEDPTKGTTGVPRSPYPVVIPKWVTPKSTVDL